MWFLKARNRKAHNQADVPTFFSTCSTSLICHAQPPKSWDLEKLKDRWVPDLLSQDKVGLFGKEGADEKKKTKKKNFTFSNECCGEIFSGLRSQSRDDSGKEWSQRLPLFSLSNLPSTAHEPCLEEGVGTSAKGCLMSFWGMVFREARQRKETGQPQSWATHPPRWDLHPPEQSQERHYRENSLLHQSNNLPMFYQQLSKQCFPGLEKCHTLLSPKQLLLPLSL